MPNDDDAPRVTRLSTTPVKGFALHHPPSVELDGAGAVGDRDFFLVDSRNRLLSISRTGAFAAWTASFDDGAATLTFTSPDGVEVAGPVVPGRLVVADFYGDHTVSGHVVDGPWAEAFTEAAGEPVRLIKATHPGSGSDEHPVTLLADESVAALAEHAAVPVDVRRFRMLIGFAGTPPHSEEEWRHRTLRVGTAVLRVGGPVPRCNGVTRHPDTGVSDLRTLHLISEVRGRRSNEFGDGLNLGAYAEVVVGGVVRVGDALHLDA